MSTMTIPHDTPLCAALPAAWPLAHGAVRALPAAGTPRLLLVLGGQVWITECVAAGEARSAVDHWLGAGQTLALPEGSRWIIEATEAARLVLLQPPPAAVRPAAASGLLALPRSAARAWLQAWHRLTARPASPAAPRAA